MPDLTNIVYRGSLNRPLTHSELDTNFNLLNSYLVEQSSNTGYAILPAGTTAERPETVSAGYFRYNNETNKLEGFVNSSWVNFNEVGYSGSVNVGLVGFTGSSGLRGFTGSSGNVGATSTVVGAIGEVGPVGRDGFTGSIGLPGLKGIDGARGSPGPASTVKGAVGYSGSLKPGTANSIYDSSSGYVQLNINNNLVLSSDGTIDINNVTISDPAICVNRNDSNLTGGSKYLSFKLNNYEVCFVMIGATGNGFIPGSNSRLRFFDTSDYRIKENLVKIDNILDKLNKLTVYICNYKTDKKRFRSLLAHELQDIFPYAVTGTKDAVDQNGLPIYQYIDYSKLIPVIISGINELTKKIEKIKNDYYIYKSTR